VKGCHALKGPPFYSCECAVGWFLFFKLCLNFGVESGLSSVHFTFGQLAFHFILFFGVGGGWGGVCV